MQSTTFSANNSEQNNQFAFIAKWLLICAPITIYFSYVQQYALNLPYWDDYDAILRFIINFKKASFSEKFSLLFEQHNEHRIFFSRLVYSTYYMITGKLNFRNIIYIDFMWLLGIWAVCISFVKKWIPQYWHIGALAFSLCLFDINNYENADFAMAGMQNFSIILLFATSILAYSKNSSKYIALGLLLQITTSFSSGNGNIASFFIFLFTVLCGDRKRMITAAIGLFVFAPLYYIHYKQPETNFFTLDPHKFVPFFLHTTGAHFSYTLGPLFAVIMVILTAILLPLRKKLSSEAAFIFSLAGFVLASVGVMSIFRANLPVEASFSSRYFIYSHLLTAIIFILLIKRLENHRYQLKTAAIFLVILMCAYEINYNMGKTGFITQHSTIRNTDFAYPSKPEAKMLTDEACKANIYCIEQARSEIR